MLGKKHSFRGSRFNSQHPHGSSQLAINPISENLISSMDTSHPRYTDIYADKTHIKLKKKESFKKLKIRDKRDVSVVKNTCCFFGAHSWVPNTHIMWFRAYAHIGIQTDCPVWVLWLLTPALALGSRQTWLPGKSLCHLFCSWKENFILNVVFAAGNWIQGTTGRWMLSH